MRFSCSGFRGRRGVGRSLPCERGGELGAGAGAELTVDLAQAELDRLGRQEQLGIDRARDLAGQAVDGWLGIKPGWTRLSFSLYLWEPVFNYVAAVHLVATHGARLLPEDRFDPASGHLSALARKFDHVSGKGSVAQPPALLVSQSWCTRSACGLAWALGWRAG
jgi:hypothetical protein